jgi:uncharacterized membrane protein
MKFDSLKYVLWLGSAIVFVTLAIMFFTNSINIFVLAAFVLGIIFVIGTLTRYAGWGCDTEDERLRKIVAYSMMNSWVSSISLLWTLMLFYYFKWSYPLSGIQVISLTIAVMLAIFYGWYVYYSFRGDVE